MSVRIAWLAACLCIIAVPAAADGGLAISDAWMRFIIPARPVAGYFTLANEGSTARELTGASSPGCGMMMIHKSMTDNGANGMTAVERVTVPAHGKVSFSPGGYHLMCMKPNPQMEEAGSVPVTLTFGDGSTLKADFAVRGAAGR